LNSTHHMKPLRTKIYYFGGQNRRNNFLSRPESGNPLSLSLPIKKELKMMKIKFDTKINFFKIRGTGHLIAKKGEGLKCIFQINLKATTYFTYAFHSSPLIFNLIFFFKCNWVLIGARLCKLNILG